MQSPEYPVHDIRWVFDACRADEALKPEDPRRYDFTELLGSSVVVELADMLQQHQRDRRFHHCVLTGHRGSGKSTQLLELKKWADEQGFLTVWNEVDVFFGLVELQFSDLFLLAAESVDRTLRENGTPLPAAKLKHVEEWFAEITRETDESRKSQLEVKAGGEIKGGLSFLGKLFAAFSAGVVAGSESHLKVRAKLRQAPNTLIDITNDLLASAQEFLAEKGRPNGLLVLFDNLDRYPTDTINNLLIKGEALIRRLGCHAVFTMPVELRRSADLPHQDAFDATALLPMIPLRAKDAPWKSTAAGSPFLKAAVDEMLAALGKRIDVNLLFEKPADAARLVRLSGGCIRDLLHLVSQARQKSRVSLKEFPAKITRQGVERAIEDYRFDLVEGLTTDDYERLARIALRRPAACEVDAKMVGYLSRRRVLFYPGKRVKWYDVHPLIVEDEGFRRAYETASASEETEA